MHGAHDDDHSLAPRAVGLQHLGDAVLACTAGGGGGVRECGHGTELLALAPSPNPNPNPNPSNNPNPNPNPNPNLALALLAFAVEGAAHVVDQTARVAREVARDRERHARVP